MASAVSGFLTWTVTYIPDFLLTHPIVDFLGAFVAIWVVGFLIHLLRQGL